jgi:hypothetical protein
MIYRLTIFLLSSWAILLANCHFFQKTNPVIFGLGVAFYCFTPLFFTLLFVRKEKISIRLYPNGLKSRHFYIWFSALFMCIVAILISTPFIKVNNILLVQLFQAWHIPLKTLWWSAPMLIGFISLIGGFSFWMLAACGQEALFRIYLVEKWKSWNFSRMWMSISLVWFLWLLPTQIINGKDIALTLIAVKCFVYCACLTMILLGFTRKEKGLALPAIFMGMIQAYESSLAFISPEANPYYYGITGWVGMGVFFIAALTSFLLNKEDLLTDQTTKESTA